MPRILHVSIRTLLSIAFLGLNVLAAALLSALSFYAARDALSEEIAHNLGNDAAMLMEQIDMMLFERLHNVHSWSHLDLMQEARIGDVDKRLARFLRELQRGYGGIYRDLFFVDAQDRIGAASEPALIGQTYPPQPPWVRATVPDGEAILEPLRLAPPYRPADLSIRAAVHDRYAQTDIGWLYARFDLEQIFRLFDREDHAVRKDLADGGRYVVLLDHEGRTIAASRSLRERGLLLRSDFAGWRPAPGQATRLILPGAPVAEDDVLLGYAPSHGYRGHVDMGWSLLVFQTTAEAFRPIRALLWLFCFAFLLTGLVASGAAQMVAARIARPLLGLTAWVRGFMRADAGTRPHIAGTREVRELGDAFGQMVESLERSREQVVRAAKLAVVGEMAAIMAHEVRTPLGILHTSAQMLQREPGLSAEGREMTRFMLEESTRLERLISTLLECARPRPPQMRFKDVHAILRRVADLLAAQARKKHLRLEWRLADEAAITACDEELLVQVFLNLVLNAIQHSPEGGRIGLASWREAQTWCFEIWDDGPGIPPDNRGRVFDPFFTTREGGIGLGLTVAQQIAAAHGGELGAGAAGSGGASFCIRLPITREETA